MPLPTPLVTRYRGPIRRCTTSRRGRARHSTCGACTASPWAPRPMPSVPRPCHCNDTLAPRSSGRWGLGRATWPSPLRTSPDAVACSCSPDAGVAIVRTIGDLERSRTLGGPMQVVICSREQAKLGYRWRPAALARPLLGADGRLVRDDAGAVLRQWCCPDCCTPIVDGEEIPLSWDDLRVKRRRCQRCDNPLWQADPTGPRRVPLADYVSRRMPRHFDLLIGDEIHEFKARGSAQGMAAGTLAEACGRTLSLTGTLMGGRARRH